nr:4-hydroxy-tetrahydrodipicolinate synthase [uncultured Butyricicoccus sp.]
MKQPIFHGAATALVTPMHEDGSINLRVLADLVEEQIQNEVDALVIAGTTGEGATLTDDERSAVIACAVKQAKGRVPVIAGAGSNCTAQAVRLARLAERAGADGLLEVTPYYNKASQEGLFLHFQAIAQATRLPLMLYNVPSRTGVNLTPDTCQRLSHIDNIAALKEASGNLAQMAKIRALCGEDLRVYVGNDDQITAALSLGACGVVSVLSNLVPQAVHEMCTAFADDPSHSQALQFRYLELIDALFCEVNPIPVKRALQHMGWQVGPCRLPLSTLPAALDARLCGVLKRYGLYAAK